MNWHRRLGLLYGVLVTLIVIMGAWWVFYLNREGHNYEKYQLQRLETDRLQAVHLIQSIPEVAADPHGTIGARYPHLHFHMIEGGWEIFIDPSAHQAVHDEGQRRQFMFITEGLFFLVLLAAGTTILTLAFRREREFKRARELFLAGATHELKTPLACIRLYTETLERPELEAADRDRIHASLLEDIDRLEAMMEQVLSVSRDETGLGVDPTDLDLAAEVRELLATMKPFLEGNGAVIETDLPDGMLIMGDRQALRVSLRNLVQNAVIHAGADPVVRMRIVTDGGKHRISVRDNGPGIPRRDRRRIFDSFFRSGAAAGGDGDGPPGTGLGLYLVKRNTAALGGSVELESEEGRGSTFTLVLPAYREEIS